MLIVTYTNDATTTCANTTVFDFPSFWNNGVANMWGLSVPLVSAAGCCASVLWHDVAHSIRWRSDPAGDYSSVSAGSTDAGYTDSLTMLGGDHFHIAYSQRPSGASATSGGDIDATFTLVLGESIVKRFDALCATTVCATNLIGTSMQATNLYATTITATTVSGNVLSGGNIYASSLTATTVSAGTLSGGNVYANAITGSIVSAGTISAYTWDDLRVSGLSMRTNASAPDLGTLCGTLLTYSFDGAATDEQVYFAIQLPHNYKLGTDLKPHVHWCKSNTDAGSAVWAIDYSAAISGSSFPTTTRLSAIADPGTSTMHVVTPLSTINGSGLTTMSSMLMFRLFRAQSDDNDDYGSDAHLLEFDLHYEIDGLGSLQEYSK